MMPDVATLYVSAIEDQEYKDEKIGFWDDVYGFDYSCIKDIALREPLVDTVELRSVVCDPAKVLHLDLMTCKKEDLTFKNDFVLTATRNDCECRGQRISRSWLTAAAPRHPRIPRLVRHLL